MEKTLTEIANKVRNLGIASHHNWLGGQDLDISRKIVRSINCVKADSRGIFETSTKFRFIEFFLKLKFNKMKYSNYFFNLAKRLGLKQIADEIFDTESKLARADCYVSPKSDDPVLQWHFDHAYSGAENVTKYIHPEAETIKFFFHLSDVSFNNGCLGYIPKSHIIAFTLKKGIYEGTLKYTPYWSLNDFRKTILINENYIYLKKNVNVNILNEFLENTEPSIFKDESKLKHNFQPIKAGGAVIFNDSGAHKGSKTNVNERLALRFFFKRKASFFNENNNL